MAGIYLHIPFCRQKCHYCNFYSLASLKYKDDFLDALCREIELQNDYLSGEPVETIYFGGGTPSLLTESELNRIFEKLYKDHRIQPDAEITLEANPDDLDKTKICELARSQVNRLSIGVQSFFDEDLKYLNRVHSSKQAVGSISEAKDAGFSNLTIDLIYGIPTLTDTNWIRNLEIFTAFGLPHLSAYALTVEPKTTLEKLILVKKAEPVMDDTIVTHFNLLMGFAEKSGLIHYEISNFCRDSHFSKHNTNYWKGKKYLGLGPSAHSFNIINRQWNVAATKRYIEAINRDLLPAEKESIGPDEQYNEYVMLSLRTMWGTNLDYIKAHFGENMASHFRKNINKYCAVSDVIFYDNIFKLSDKGKLIADRITMDLFV